MARVHGGFANRVYRLDTDQGSFAVKELNLVDRRWTYHVRDVFRFERAAFAAGIPMPEPISASHHTLDVEWTHVSMEDPTSRDWPELAERAVATGQPWADELASHVGTFLAIA